MCQQCLVQRFRCDWASKKQARMWPEVQTKAGNDRRGGCGRFERRECLQDEQSQLFSPSFAVCRLHRRRAQPRPQGCYGHDRTAGTSACLALRHCTTGRKAANKASERLVLPRSGAKD